MTKSGAEELFDQIVAAGWAGIERWKLENQAETYLLEFKGLGHENPKLGKFDKESIGKAASGFANASGGVLVIGIVTTKSDGVDAVDDIRPTASLRAYHAAISAHLAQCSDPRVPGARAEPIAKSDDEGVVAILFPPGDGGPHRAKVAGDHTDKYFHRQGTSTLVLEHPLLASMFGRTPQPKLQLIVRVTNGASMNGVFDVNVELRLRNVGRGTARRPAIQFTRWPNVFDANEPHAERSLALGPNNMRLHTVLKSGFSPTTDRDAHGDARLLYAPHQTSEIVLYPSADVVVDAPTFSPSSSSVANIGIDLRGVLFALDMQPIGFGLRHILPVGAAPLTLPIEAP